MPMNANVLLSAVFVLATAVANILQKKAMTSLGATGGLSIAVFQRLLASPYLWGGMAAYALALAMYLVLLARVPLNVATSIASLNFIAVLLASRLVLGEPIPMLRYLGFGCILVGMLIVARAQS
jgi:drug/metabolite transporter (DMT)-like permease